MKATITTVLVVGIAALAACAPPSVAPRAAEPSIRAEPTRVVLGDKLARQQILVTEVTGDREIDRTRDARVVPEDPSLVAVLPGGVLEPLRSGTTAVMVRVGDRSVRVHVTVTLPEHEPAPGFRAQVEPLLAKAGCNAGACHGAFAGKGGLRLSLFGHEPDADHAALTDPTRGRIDRVDPMQSLLLQKAVGEAGHAGGARIARGSHAYQTLARWLATGTPLEPATEAELTRLEVSPSERVLSGGAAIGGDTQLLVTAVFTDGRRQDVTATALYTSKDPGVAEVAAGGLVAARHPGETAVVAQYLGKFATSYILVPRPGPRVAPASMPRPQTLVDEHVFARLARLNVAPAPLCDDATFLRRVMVDLIGTIPTVAEARAFQDDRRADKRDRLIDTLLTRPEYASWWATLLSDLTGNDNRYFGYDNWKHGYAWWSWLRARIDRGQPYDAMVRDVLLATTREGRSWEEMATYVAEEKPRIEDRNRWDLRYADRKTLDLFWSKGSNRAPAVVAQEVSYAFLGVRIDCAQCHKHPFDRWTQEDFWRFAAFFPRVAFGYPSAVLKKFPGERPPFKELFIARRGENPWIPIKHPKTGAILGPKLLGAEAIADDETSDPREPLARWITAPDNPYFARAIVNRVFAHHFGRGLVEPTDAISAANPPSDPALLDALTRDFVAHGFDLRRLHRVLVGSAAYQLAARPSPGDDDPMSRAHYRVRRLPAELIVDAINDVTGHPTAAADGLTPPGTRAITYAMSRPYGQVAYPFAIFGRPIRATTSDCERDNDPSLPQAIYLMNDAELLAKIKAPDGQLARLVASGASDGAIVDEVTLAALGRLPRPTERERILSMLAAWQAPGGRSKGDARREALEDYIATLLALDEFQTNH